MRKIWTGISALLVAGSTLVAAAPAQADTPRPEVIHTVASNAIGGLPIKSLDGTKEYIPQAPGRNSYWLDVELPTATSINQPGPDCYPANFWTCDPKVNSTIVAAAIAALAAQHEQAGIYFGLAVWRT